MLKSIPLPLSKLPDLKTDILVFAAHPDDAELACGGTLAAASHAGKSVVIVDLSIGEMGTRGTPEQRRSEALASKAILGLSAREILDLPDGHIFNTAENRLKLIGCIRHYKPEIVLCNAIKDRHPDHGQSAALEKEACFLAGLQKIVTTRDGIQQTAHRPRRVFHYIQDEWINPDFVVDISDFWSTKEAAIRAFSSQFYDPNSKEPSTYISNPSFLDFVKSRSREMGHFIGKEFGEGFTASQPPGVSDILSVL